MADILSHARASCSVAVLAAGGMFGTDNSGLQKVFFFFFFVILFIFFNGNTLYRNHLIKDAECQCGVSGIGNFLCHEGGESSAYVSVPCVVKLLAESHLDQSGNRVY